MRMHSLRNFEVISSSQISNDIVLTMFHSSVLSDHRKEASGLLMLTN